MFVDEANDLFSSAKNGSRGDTSLINLFLQKTNNSAERGIIVIAATNYKEQIEDAMLSRLGKQIYVSHPDEQLRKALVESEIKRSKYTLNIADDDIKELVDKLSGFSSRDITKIIKETINEHLTYSEEQMTIDEFRSAVEQHILARRKTDESKTAQENLMELIKNISESDAQACIRFILNNISEES